MKTPREEKSISQPEISPKAREAADAEVQLWLCRDKQEPGIHVQQLLNASAAQQRKEISAKQAEVDQTRTTRREFQRLAMEKHKKDAEELASLNAELIVRRAEIAALTKERDDAVNAITEQFEKDTAEMVRGNEINATLRAEIAALKEEKERLRERCGELAGYNVRDAVEKLALRTEIAALKETERLIRITVQAGDRPLDPEVSSVVHKMFGLQREVFALEKDRDALRERAERAEAGQGVLFVQVLDDRDALRVRLEAMRDDLKEYGRHYQSCRIGISCVCSCGLDAALASEAPNSTRKEGDEICAMNTAPATQHNPVNPTHVVHSTVSDIASDGAPSSDPTDAPNQPCQTCGGAGYITHGPHGGICSDCHGSGLLIQPPTQHAPSEETPETTAIFERQRPRYSDGTTNEEWYDHAVSLERRLRAALAERDEARNDGKRLAWLENPQKALRAAIDATLKTS